MKNFIWIIIILLIAGCTGPKYYVKQAQKYEKQKNYEQAVVNYNEALLQDPNHKDARKGLKKSGQRLMNELIKSFDDAYNSGNYLKAIEKYQEIDRLKKNVERRKIDLEIPDDLNTAYKTCIENQCREYYHSALRTIDNRDYELTSDFIRKIEKIDPTYEHLGQLRTAVKADPYYTSAIDAYNRGEFARSYQSFQQVEKIDPGYRETAKYMEELGKKYAISVALFPLENQTQNLQLSDQLYQSLESELFKQRSRIMQVSDKETIAEALRKANIPVYLPLSEKDALNVSKSLGTNRYILCTLNQTTNEKMPRQEEIKTAYLKERVLYFDQWSGTQMSNYQYREIKYKEVSEEIKFSITMRYRIFDSTTGTLTYSNQINKAVINQIKFAEYTGVTEDLYPTTGYISQTDLRKWRSRFDAANDRKSDQELLNILIRELTKQWIDEVNGAIFK
ncbi:MAG: hypothetical protein IAE67_06785 [Candidatus Competibacteraceae bacterium]|nr:hypothetical protein [Candidatus Competibacteraceae bacterium]